MAHTTSGRKALVRQDRGADPVARRTSLPESPSDSEITSTIEETPACASVILPYLMFGRGWQAAGPADAVTLPALVEDSRAVLLVITCLQGE